MAPHQHVTKIPAQVTLRRVGDAIAAICVGIAGCALLAIVALNGANVVGRYFFNAPISWAEELMLFLMVLIVFAAAVGVTWQARHIRIDLFVERLPAPWRRAASLGIGILSMAILAGIGLVSLSIVTRLYAFDQRSEALELPVWIPQSFVAAGMLLMAAMLVLRFACALREAAQADHAPTAQRTEHQ